MVRGHLVADVVAIIGTIDIVLGEVDRVMNAALQATLEFLKLYWAPLLCGVAVVAILPLVVGYIVLVERKIMADMQARLGPMRVGAAWLLQPIADAVMKLLIKEDIHPGERGQARLLARAGAFRWCGAAFAGRHGDRTGISDCAGH